MVLGLIETVDTVMGHISSNLDASQPQVTIVGSSSMAGTGRLRVGCSHGCRCRGRGLRRSAGLCGLLCQPRAHPHAHKQGRTHLHRGAHTPAEMSTQRTHTCPQVRTRSRTGAHTPAHASVHTARKHTGKGTHACRCADTHTGAHTHVAANIPSVQTHLSAFVNCVALTQSHAVEGV